MLAIRGHRTRLRKRKIGLCNSGILGFRGDTLRSVIDRIDNKNAEGEYYLTDAIELAAGDKKRRFHRGRCKRTGWRRQPREAGRGRGDVPGIQTHCAHGKWRDCAIRRAPGFSWDTEIGRDVTIFPNVVFGPGVKIADNVEIRAFCDIEDVNDRGGGPRSGPSPAFAAGPSWGRMCIWAISSR